MEEKKEEPAVFVTRSDEKNFPFAFLSFPFDLMMKGILFFSLWNSGGPVRSGSESITPTTHIGIVYARCEIR